MQRRRLGNTGIEVSPLCFGGNVFGWTADEPTSFALLDTMVAAGVNFVDTADTYSRWVPGNQGGESETVIGNWLARRGRRDDVVIATKVGMEMGPGRKGLSKAWILRAADDSLRRLRTDYVDLYQSHTDDASVPIEETLSAYETLIRQGKVRAIGASNFGAARLAESLDTAARLGLPAYATLQPLYNLYEREAFEKELEPLCRERGIAVINYYALASGFLSGKYRGPDDLVRSPRGAGVGRKYLNERGTRILAALDEVASALQATPAQVAIAWLLARPGVTAPIASASTLAQLDELIAATRLRLDDAQIRRLDQASAW